MTVNQALGRTDWKLLAQQKLALVNSIPAVILAITRDAHKQVELIDGLLNWIDAIQDAAEGEGFPVVFLEDDDA